MSTTKAKSQALLHFFATSKKNSVEICVDGLGWLIVLRENIEIVADNWFTSSKYLASTVEAMDQEGAVIRLTNVYKINASFIENANNVKYNLTFDEIYICSDKITAYF